MHNCVRCGRAAGSLQEINDGCPCGSKVFVFNRDAASIAGEETVPKQAKPEAPGGNGEFTIAQDGKVPESYHARMSFSTEDVENIKVLTEGVFALELRSLYKDPVVLKDEDGIYYVKIPFEQNEKALKELGKRENGKGKKE